jgi:hypothetical protein
MSRRVRLFAIALLASFALSAAACGNLTAPDGNECSVQGSNTCSDMSVQGSNT